MKIALATIGCRSNQADSVALARQLQAYNIEIVEDFSQAGAVIVNTCCVTQEAERDCRKTIRRALSASENLKAIVFGCTVNAFPSFFSGEGDRVEILSGEEAKPTALVNKIAELAGGAMEPSCTPKCLPGPLGRTRALLKIQNGCSHFCTYCIVPKARGREESLSPGKVIERVDSLIELGYKEIVLTGVQLGAWGKDLKGKPSLTGLIDKVADRVKPGRLRLSSIEPWAVDKELIQTIGEHDRICSHLHLPLQSGDDNVLAAMRRGYTSSEYLKTIELIKSTISNVAIGTDVLFGFPGEDEKAFSNTINILKRMQPAYLHAFTFSPRPGTKAAQLPDRPEKAIAKERTRAARKEGEEFLKKYRASQVGKEREVIVEETLSGHFRGLTDTFIPVRLEDKNLCTGKLVNCLLKKPTDGDNRMLAKPI